MQQNTQPSGETGTNFGPAPFGFKIVAGAWVAQLFAMGLIIGSYPVFMSSIEQAFGASRAQTSLGIPLVLLAGAVFSPVLGRWVDRGSPQWIMAAGAVMMSLGLWVIAACESLLLLTLTWIVMIGLGTAMLGVIPANTVLANWFVKRRALMIAVAGTGLSVGSAIFPHIAEFLISGSDWRIALSILALACLLIPAPVALICITKSPPLNALSPDVEIELPKRIGPTAADIKISFFRDGRYWLVGISLACMPAVHQSFVIHAVGWSEDLRFGREFGVNLLSVTAVTLAVSSLFFGKICDFLGAIDSLRFALIMEIVGWLIMLAASDQTEFLTGAIIFAAGAGSWLPCQVSLLSQTWPVDAFGQAMGHIMMIVVAGIFIVPTAVGFGFEHNNGYAIPMQCILAVLATPLLLLTIFNWKMANRQE